MQHRQHPDPEVSGLLKVLQILHLLEELPSGVGFMKPFEQPRHS